MLGIGVIAGVECVIFANDPTVLGGALTPYRCSKMVRALEIARDNRIPFVFCRVGRRDLPRTAEVLRCPAERSFCDLTRALEARIPSVCVVFGSSTAAAPTSPACRTTS